MEKSRNVSENDDVWPFPPEISVQIFQDLIPYEVLKLSEVCRLFNDLVNDRALWTHLVHQMCREHRLFAPSFPVLEMEVPALKRAALLSRTSKQFLSRNTMGPNDNLSRPYYPRTRGRTDISRLLGVRYRQHVVPGGRFVVVVEPLAVFPESISGGVELWDAGLLGGRPGPPALMARVQFEDVIGDVFTGDPRENAFTQGWIDSAICLSDEHTLRVGVAVEAPPELDVIKLCVWEIDFATGALKITLRTNCDIRRGDISGAKIVMSGDTIFLDIRRKPHIETYVALDVAHHSYYPVVMDCLPRGPVVFTGDFILTMTRKDVWAWPIPPPETWFSIPEEGIELGDVSSTLPDLMLAAPWNGRSSFRTQPAIGVPEGIATYPLSVDVFDVPSDPTNQTPSSACRYIIDRVEESDPTSTKSLSIEKYRRFHFSQGYIVQPFGQARAGSSMATIYVRPMAASWPPPPTYHSPALPYRSSEPATSFDYFVYWLEDRPLNECFPPPPPAQMVPQDPDTPVAHVHLVPFLLDFDEGCPVSLRFIGRLHRHLWPITSADSTDSEVDPEEERRSHLFSFGYY